MFKIKNNIEQIMDIKFVSDLRQVGGFLRVLQFPPPIQLIICNIVESGVKHQDPNIQFLE
jgi:hypothetical protein